jgi:CBS domain-containing protein
MNAIPIVRNFMTHKVFTIKPEADVHDAIQQLLKKRISGAPVVDCYKNLVGILSEKDCLRMFVGGAYSKTPGGLVSEFMTQNILTCTPEDDLFKVADLFFSRSFRRLPVVEDGQLVGLVSRCDVLKASIDIWKDGGQGGGDSNYLSIELQAKLKDRHIVRHEDVRVDGLA